MITLVVAVNTAVSISGFAENSAFGDNAEYKEFKGKKWREGNLILPDFPHKKNLIELELPHSRVKYYIDAKSVSVGKDHVARYTVVIESSSGSKNVFYEGIRCSTKQFKTYAYAVNTKQLKPMPNAIWREIRGVGAYKYRLSLYEYYVCQNSAVRYKAHQIIQVLRTPSSLSEPGYIE